MRILNWGSMNLDYVYKVDHFVLPGETISSSGISDLRRKRPGKSVGIPPREIPDALVRDHARKGRLPGIPDKFRRI